MVTNLIKAFANGIAFSYNESFYDTKSMKKIKFMKARWLAALAIFLSWILHLYGYEANPFSKKESSEGEEYVLQALRVTTSPKVDGYLEAEIWEPAPAATKFIQKQPAEGEPATEEMEVRILYDKKNLYIGVMCYDSEPGKIISNEKKRDSNNIYDNDHVQIMLDTFRDRRNGYIFVINPLGAKLDLQVRREGKSEGPGHLSNPNINVDWNGVWDVKSVIQGKGWSAEIEIPLASIRFNESSKDGWGVNFLRNIRRKNEMSTWAPLPRNLDIYKISLAGDLIGLEGLKKGLNLQVKPFLMANNVSQRDEGGTLSGKTGIDGGIDLKYGLTSNLTLELTANTDFSQVEADDQQINLTRFSLYFPEKREFFLENAAIFSIGSPDDAMIFFSRGIGISPQGEEIPLLGGVKLAGKVGRFNIGLINIQTQTKAENPANNFGVLRISRDILGQSAIGFMMTNRQSKISGDFNRAFAFDGDFVLGEHFNLSGYLAFTSSPDFKGKNGAAKLRFKWVSDNWDIYGYYFDIHENFNAEMGFVKRTGIRHAQIHTSFTPEPNIPGVRRLNPHIRFDYTTDQQSKLLWRKLHVDMAVDLLNGGRISFQWNGEREFIDFPFRIKENITLPVGSYHSPYWQMSFGSDRSLALWTDSKYRWGGFYGGKGRILDISVGWRPIPNFISEFGLVYNDIDLPQGDFVNHLLIVRLAYNFSTRISLMSLIQWNSDTGEVNVNMKLDFIHTLGSNLFIVYNERHLVEGLETGILDRTIAIKFTYLFNL